MQEDDLNSLLINNNQRPSAPQTEGAQGQSVMPPPVGMQQPKLKKVKRPKIRPMTDMPQAPAKIMPEELESSSSSGNMSVLETDRKEEIKQTTSIVRAVDAQEMVAENTFTTAQSSYALDGLPPELDYVTDDDIEDYHDNNYVRKNLLYIASCLCLLIGLFMGKTLFATQTVEQHGLEGVVLNPDIPSGRPRCGRTDKSQACVFYLMNWYKQELNGRDFYKLAANLTGREEYMIETDNLRYATVKIKPGAFAQLNIPALK